MGSTLRICGGVIIAVPVLAIAFSIYDTGIHDIVNDVTAVTVMASCYAAFGWLLIVLGNKVSPTRRLQEGD